MEIIEQLQFLVSQAIENRALERSRGVFGDSGGILGRLSASWMRLGLTLKASESYKASWRCFGSTLGHLERLLGGSWEALEASRDHFGSIFAGFSCVLSNI